LRNSNFKSNTQLSLLIIILLTIKKIIVMRKITFTSVLVILAIFAIAQPPQAFKYQTVVRDGAGANTKPNG
jgi:hypothetical protein